MYFSYYQKDENEAFAAYKALTHKVRKCVTELPIFMYLSFLTNVVQKLWESLRDYPVQPLQKLQVSSLFHLPASTAWMKHQAFSR